jgi:hypothetical protein
MPSVKVRATSVILPGGCTANVWVDGVRADSSEALKFHPDEVAAVEVYPRIFSTPAEFMVRGAGNNLCGSVVVWTKRGFP